MGCVENYGLNLVFILQVLLKPNEEITSLMTTKQTHPSLEVVGGQKQPQNPQQQQPQGPQQTRHPFPQQQQLPGIRTK